MLHFPTLNKKRFKNLEEFYLHNIIRLMALSMFDIFSSIYVFTILKDFGLNNSHALGGTALFLSLIYFVHLLTIKSALYLIKNFSLQFSMFWGSMLLVLFSAFLYMAKFNLYFLIPAAAVCGVYIGLYYTGYHIYFAQLTDDKREGQELAVGNALFALVGILGPVTGGFIIAFWGFGALFLAMALILLLSGIPLNYISGKTMLKINLGDFDNIFRFKNERKNLLAIFGLGVVDCIAAYFWPLFIFGVLAGNFINVGVLGSVMAGVSIVSAMLIGWLIDRFKPERIIKPLSLSDSLAWIVRAFSATPALLYLSSILQSAITHNISLNMDAMIYEKARSRGSIGPIIQREVGFAVSKSIFLLLSGLILWLGFPLFAIFLIASLAALLPRLYNTSLRIS